MSLFDLSDRTAVVTGGNRGIGFAIAEGLATQGARVVIANRNEQGGLAAVQRLLDQGLRAEAVTTDVSVGASVAHLVDAVLQRHGRIDILVNSAAVITESRWRTSPRKSGTVS